MPRSDTWPGGVAVETLGGITVETLGGMDSAGSCDSVVSLRSGFSESGLEQLSAEERECILFLEKTIESLLVDEDSDPPRDEPDFHLATGSLAEKIAHLSVSLSGSVSQHPHVGPKGEGGKECKSVAGFLVPTPLVMANTEAGVGSLPTVSGRVGLSPGPNAVTAHRKEGRQDHPRASASRGPLSNQGLLELRSKPPLKKHAQSFSAGEKAKLSPHNKESQADCSSDSTSQYALLHQTPKPKAVPPVVAPKPKKLPPRIAPATHKANVPDPDPKMHGLGTSPREWGIMDPQRVRREALAKLGLLQDGGPAPPPVVRTLPPAMTRPRSRSDLPLVSLGSQPHQSTGGMPIPLERSSVSFDCCPASKSRLRARTTSLRDRKEFEAGQPGITASEHLSHKPLFPNGISTSMAPWNQPGQVRQEALRKLGLLRE